MNVVLDGHILPREGAHGVSHWARVLENGIRLAERTGADSEIVALFAMFHDSRRVNEHDDDGHGLRGGEFARSLRGILVHLSDSRFELLFEACRLHADGYTTGDPTMLACWDADRLDLGRVGITPDARRLCSDAARELLPWATPRGITRHESVDVLSRWGLVVPAPQVEWPMFTPEQAKRAIYFDFEGLPYKPPALLGILVDEEMEQVVLDRALVPFANELGCRAGYLTSEMEALQMRGRREGRRLAGFTQHEPRSILNYAWINLAAVYDDVHKMAKRWTALHHAEDPIDDYKLQTFLSRIEYPLPVDLLPNQAANQLTRVSAMLSEVADYDNLTDEVKIDWKNLLLHNEHDCRGTRALAEKAASELAQ